MSRPDHHVLLHEVVREPSRSESVAKLALAMRPRRDLAHVWIDHRRPHPRELARLQQVLDDVELRALAIQLEEDLVSFA
jgi:hypothetical protein